MYVGSPKSFKELASEAVVLGAVAPCQKMPVIRVNMVIKERLIGKNVCR
jgi:hypothetical protein